MTATTQFVTTRKIKENSILSPPIHSPTFQPLQRHDANREPPRTSHHLLDFLILPELHVFAATSIPSRFYPCILSAPSVLQHHVVAVKKPKPPLPRPHAHRLYLRVPLCFAV